MPVVIGANPLSGLVTTDIEDVLAPFYHALNIAGLGCDSLLLLADQSFLQLAPSFHQIHFYDINLEDPAHMLSGMGGSPVTHRTH